MISPGADTRAPHPEALDFVRFCYRRKRVGWPELYDEMCAVAGRGLFRGYSADDLGGIGIGLCLSDMPGLAALVVQVVGEEMPARRAVGARIVTDQHEEQAVSGSREDAGPVRTLRPVTAGA